MRMNNPEPLYPTPPNINITLPNNINIRYAYLPNGDRIMRESENETEASTTFYLYDREDRIGDYDPSDDLRCGIIHPAPQPESGDSWDISIPSIIIRDGRQGA